jgi:hypothetical protein
MSRCKLPTLQQKHQKAVFSEDECNTTRAETKMPEVSAVSLLLQLLIEVPELIDPTLMGNNQCLGKTIDNTSQFYIK